VCFSCFSLDHFVIMLFAFVMLGLVSSVLKGNSTLKNISPKINIYDNKRICVSFIKLMMQITYRRILMIKLLLSRNVFLHGGRSSKLSSLFYIYVYLLMTTWLPETVIRMFFVHKNVR